MAQVETRTVKEQLLNLLKEKERRLKLPINTYVPDSTPDRNQLAFHESQARYRVGFGGNRAGKSVMSSYETAATARGCHRFQEIPPGPKTIYVISAEYRTLYQGIYRHLMPDESGMKFLDPKWIKAVGPKVAGASVPLPSYIQVYCQQDEKGNPITGEAKDRPYSTIWFISGDGGEQARKKMQAAAVDLAVIDEEVPQSIFEELQVRLLDNDGRIVISATLVKSEEWLMNLEDRANEGDESVCLVRLSSETSKHLSDSARKEIYAGMTEDEYKVRVLGMSRRSFGLTYSNFNESHICRVSELFPNGIQAAKTEEFQIITCNDPGWRTHAVLYALVDTYHHTLYFYRELYLHETPLHDVCKIMAASEGYDLQQIAHLHSQRIKAVPEPEEVDVRLIDPAALRMSDAGQMGVAVQMAAYYDTPCVPANNNLDAGIQAVNRLLDINPNTGTPHLQFDVNLVNLLRERRKYRYRKDTSGPNAHATKVEPVKKEDHLMDCMRYICLYCITLFSGEQPKRTSVGQNYNRSTHKSQMIADRLLEQSRKNTAFNGSYVGSEY